MDGVSLCGLLERMTGVSIPLRDNNDTHSVEEGEVKASVFAKSKQSEERAKAISFGYTIPAVLSHSSGC